jgi:triosephosphate isomerase
MRRKLLAGNWKMNLDRAGAVALAQALVAGSKDATDVDLLVCPPYVYLDAVAGVLKGSRIALGAQDVYHEAPGAFTGEIATSMLKDLGCTHVILGHSERRHLMGEDDQAVNRKLHAALAAGLTPVVCVGEQLSERESGQTQAVIRRQFEQSLAGISPEQMRKIVLAYEPVWAIGTGKVATPEQAEEVHSDLRKLLQDRYNAEVASEVRVLYGGSVKPSNTAELVGQPNVDGALVGGASLKAEDFLGIVAAAQGRR